MSSNADAATNVSARDRPPWLGAGYSLAWIDTQWLIVAGVMLVSALVFFGWRAAVAALVTSGAAVATNFVLALFISRYRPAWNSDPVLHVLGQAFLLSMCLPVTNETSPASLAGAMLGVLMTVMGRSRWLRVSPVALVIVLLWLMPAGRNMSLQAARQPYFRPIEAVLVPWRAFVGDIRDTAERSPAGAWYEWRRTPSSLSGESGSASTQPFTHEAAPRHSPGTQFLDDRLRLLAAPSMFGNMIRSGELPRIEEVIIGSVPGGAGATSRALLAMIGVYLIVRRLASWKVMSAAFVASMFTLLVMPIESLSFTQTVGVTLWRHGAALAFPYLCYMLLASPLPLIVFVLGASGMPLTRRGRIVYGAILGASSMAAMWFLGMITAAFLGLLLAGAMSRLLDRIHRRTIAP